MIGEVFGRENQVEYYYHYSLKAYIIASPVNLIGSPQVFKKKEVQVLHKFKYKNNKHLTAIATNIKHIEKIKT